MSKLQLTHLQTMQRAVSSKIPGAVDFANLVITADQRDALIVFRGQTTFTPKGFARQLASGRYDKDVSQYTIVPRTPEIRIDFGDIPITEPAKITYKFIEGPKKSLEPNSTPVEESNKNSEK